VGGALYFSASYNADRVRINKTDTRGALGLQVHNYSYGPMGLLHEDNPTTIYTPGFGHRSNGINSFYHTDWLGSTRYTSDSTGNTFPQGLRYDACGNRSATLDPNNWQPTDKQWAGLWGYQTEWASATDPGLGLDYLQQRYYDPAVDRFLSPDPLGFLGGTNLYGYVENDPVSGVDPSGLGDPEEDVEAALQRRETQRVQVNRLQRQVHTGLKTAIDVGSSFEPVSNVMMAVNDAGEGNWWSAALRLSGPLLKLFGRGARFCRAQKALPAFIPPRGFVSAAQFESFVARFRTASGIEDAFIGVRGSAATGVSFKTGLPFGPGSDIDFFIVSDK
jgi:RHS repeat-associated protein